MVARALIGDCPLVFSFSDSGGVDTCADKARRT
jgi:hypothetical protein